MTCREISKVVSDSLDRELPFRVRMELRLHLMMCGLCRNYHKQSLLIRKSLRFGGDELTADHSIPEAAALRIQEALNAAVAEK